MNKEGGTLTVKIKGQDILDMKEDIRAIKEMLSKGEGKISFNRKMIIGCYIFCMSILGFLIGHIGGKP